jgi:ABC-type nitrate/sulfonate/bicarbonate transport system ATPase subunit/ABC-type nitrate/sulfonate/bicarbonate transport system permease component
MITMEAVDFSYRLKGGMLPVLSGLNAEFERGSITAIVGKSGCGKTTLLRLLAGLASPTGGTIRIDGRSGGTIREGTAIIFQDFGLLPWATLRQNAELGLASRAIDRAERRKRVDPILKELGLEEFEHFFPSRLSGGMKQRVAVARALASDSDILLLDEPFSSLDAITRESLQDTLLKTQKKHGTTVILVTHSIEEAAYLADYVYILEGKNPSRLSLRHLMSSPSTGVTHQASKDAIPLHADGYRETELYFNDVRTLRHLVSAVPGNEAGQGASFSAGATSTAASMITPSPLESQPRKNPFLSRIAKLSLAIGLVFALWQVAASLLALPFIPSPLLALRSFAENLSNGTLSKHAAASLGRVCASLAIAGPVAWGLGLMAGRFPHFDTLASPLMYLFHPLPKVAFLPLLMLVFGLGDASKIALMSLVIFGQLFVGARDSAKAIPPSLVDTLRSLGGHRWRVLYHGIFPATLPALLSSIRISLGTAIAVLFLSETFASMDGLGWYIMDAWSRVDYPDMYSAIMTLSGVGLSLYLILDAIEAWLLRWRD